MTGLVAGMGVKAALGAAGARLKQISPRTWLIIGCVLAALLGALWAHHWYVGQIKAAEKRGSDAAYANVARQADALTAKANALNVKLAAQIRKQTDAKLAAVHDDAAGLQLRGPGAARCPGVTRLPGASGGHDQASALANAAGPALLADDLAAVPWRWLVGRGDEHDALLTENQAWREWYTTFKKQWDDWNKAAAKARTP